MPRGRPKGSKDTKPRKQRGKKVDKVVKQEGAVVVPEPVNGVVNQ